MAGPFGAPNLETCPTFKCTHNKAYRAWSLSAAKRMPVGNLVPIEDSETLLPKSAATSRLGYHQLPLHYSRLPFCGAAA